MRLFPYSCLTRRDLPEVEESRTWQFHVAGSYHVVSGTMRQASASPVDFSTARRNTQTTKIRAPTPIHMAERYRLFVHARSDETLTRQERIEQREILVQTFLCSTTDLTFMIGTRKEFA